MPQRSKKIGLLDHMGGGNLGDDTTQTAVIANIRSRWPDAEICGFSMNPLDTRSRHAIPAYPIRRKIWENPDRPPDDDGISNGTHTWVETLLRLARAAMVAKPRAVGAELVFLTRSFFVVRSLDVLVISGGGQLLDSWGGPWDYPFTIFKWVLLAKLSGAKCYFVSVGAGPLKHPLSRFFIRRALALADYVSLRDRDSRTLVQRIGFNGEAQIFPDCVYSLKPHLTDMNRREARGVEVVGLSPMAYCDPRRYWIRDQAAYEAFIGKIVSFGSSLSKTHCLTLFSTDIWFDAQTLEAIGAALKDESRTDVAHLLPYKPISSLETLISHMASVDYIITCRFHGVVFAHLMNIPVIALSHHPKVTTLMAELGLSEFCLDIDTFDPESLMVTLNRMVADKLSIKTSMAEKLSFFRNELTGQFNRLFAPEVSQ